MCVIPCELKHYQYVASEYFSLWHSSDPCPSPEFCVYYLSVIKKYLYHICILLRGGREGERKRETDGGSEGRRDREEETHTSERRERQNSLK